MTSSEASLLLSSLQVASNHWIQFDWSKQTKQWDSTMSQNKEAREHSQAARKQLAETTKQFKRSVKNVETAGTTLGSANTPENAAAAVKTIEALAKNSRVTVKSYQEEIDNLTRRCKASESAFANLTQALGDVPDPAAVLATALEHIHEQQKKITELVKTVDDLDKEKAALMKSQKAAAAASNQSNNSSESGLGKRETEELMQLRREVAEYEVEFRSLKNQDITIRKLEARILELQKGGEEEFNAKLEKAKQELAETEGRRTAEALEREAAMERRAQTLELQLKAEHAGRAATQAHLLEASEGVGEREAVWEAQRRILVDDAERLRLDLYEATRERNELRLKVAALDGPGGATKVPSTLAPNSGGITIADLLSEREAYEAEVSELSNTVSALREEASLKESAMDDERHSLQTQITSLEREIGAMKTRQASLESQLSNAPSQSLVENMKRELRILKRLEYNADDQDFAERDPEMTGPEGENEKDLESVLVAKLRRVEAELVKERNQKSELTKNCEQLRKEIAVMETDKAEADRVIASLERDLDKAITTSSSPQKKEKKKAQIMATSDPSTLQSVLDPDAFPPPPPANKSVSDVSTKSSASTAAEKAADDHSVATIIMAQRDRLRARCDALEAERDSFKRELQAQVDAAESLKADNTKLFEKMRYLQSYSGNSSSGGAAARGAAYARSNSRDLDLEALEQRYEASVDPFRQFSRAERQRKLREMSPMERTVFVVAKTVLGTKEMRTFLFFYVLAMHMLVFMTTYHWSHSESSCGIAQNEHLSHLPPLVDKTAEQIVQDLSGKTA